MSTSTIQIPTTEGAEAVEPTKGLGRGWYQCMVDKAGPAEDGTVYIWLRHRGGKFNCWFSASMGVKREMLATALSAIASGKAVDAQVDDTTEYSVIERIYVLAQ